MGTFKFLVIVTLVATGLIANAQSVAKSFFTRDLLTSAKTLKTEKRIYNYFHMQTVHPELETEQGRHAYVNRYLAARGGDFWRDSFTDTSPTYFAAGAGLYFAIDPLISQSYGDSFIEMTMPAGTRFINVVRPISLKRDTLAALVSEGYVTQSQIPLLFPKSAGFYRDTLRMMVDPQFRNFKKLVHQIFTANHIQFVEYNFNSSLGRFCATHSYSAFVYVGEQNESAPENAKVPQALQNTMLFSTQLNIPNLSAAEQARKDQILKFRSTLEKIKGQSSASAKQIISSVYTPEDYAAVKDTAFSCE